jgi:regulator of protease activity HflC (stomatin/prohibitin superfamily)
MSYLWDMLDPLWNGLYDAFLFAVDYVRKHPTVLFFILALLRLLGTTVQTGSKGVLFVFGRVRRELEPGFHPLLPLIMTVRKIPVRSVTQQLPRQRLTTADGLVYDVQANIVYRVVDPKLALTQIDHLRKGIEAMLSLMVAEQFRGLTRVALRDFKTLETDLIARAEQQVRRWGVMVEQAGFNTIAPTRKTLHLTQLAALIDERAQTRQTLIAQGVSLTAAVALLGADRRLVGHATARYRALHRSTRLAPAAEEAPQPLPLRPGEAPPIAQPQPQERRDQEAETREVDLTVAAEEAALPAPRPPKKTTRGVQPRSWLRLQRRLGREVGGSDERHPLTSSASGSSQR